MRKLVGTAVAALLAASLPSALAASPKAPPRPAFTSYRSPGNLGNSAGEPTLGINPRTGSVLFQAGTETLRVTDFDRGGKGKASWTDVSSFLTSLYTFDPILDMDHKTGRAWVSQLDLYCSRISYTDDDGETWTQVPLGCSLGALFDHQSVGHGPFRPGLPLRGVTYDNAVYYCAHNLVTANCGTSLDGGRTFLPAVTAWSLAECGSNFGHIKSAPDGTVYVPPTDCYSSMGVAVSEDNGVTWQIRRIPDSVPGDSGHPSLGVGADGTVYYAWGGGLESGPGGPPYVAVSTDKGRTWTAPALLGGEFGLNNTRFTTVVAGDGDRAAVAYLGTKDDDDASAPGFAGDWRLYVSFTYDRGRTWTTVNATPDSPVQVGPVCTDGIACPDGTRNLLDFNDLVIDEHGRVLAAIADGCPSPSVKACRSVRAEKATIVRQTSGRGLLRKYDGLLARR